MRSAVKCCKTVGKEKLPAPAADAAAVIPIEIKRNDRTTTLNQLVCFDLTTGAGDEKIERIRTEFYGDGEKTAGKYGLAELKHPSTCLGRTVSAPLEDVPHFVLCLPRKRELEEFEISLAGHKPLPRGIQDLMNFQLYRQAAHWAYHWRDEQKAEHPKPGAQEKAQLFAAMALHFRQQWMGEGSAVDQASEAAMEDKILEEHPEATKFISELIINKR